MRDVCSRLAIIAAFSVVPLFAADVPSPFSGRWDLTILTSTGSYPAWMEFADEAGTPAIRIVGRTGSVHPVLNAKLEGARLAFEDGSAPWHMLVKDRKLTGQAPDGPLVGVPAPALNHKTPDSWSAPEPLFNGRDLSGWAPDNPAANHWIAANGELQNLHAGANLRTTRTFGDFKLHIEYNCPPGGNSGVYLRGRYEVRVEYEPPAKNDAFHGMGSIYGFIPPATVVDARPGQWEGFDVVGRSVTVVHDGVLVIDKAGIPGIAGGALERCFRSWPCSVGRFLPFWRWSNPVPPTAISAAASK